MTVPSQRDTESTAQQAGVRSLKEIRFWSVMAALSFLLSHSYDQHTALLAVFFVALLACLLRINLLHWKSFKIR
jgi:amino acid permease